MSEEMNSESLQKSIKTVGELYPILENQDGKILDGTHRVESNPKHHRKTIQTKNRTEEILVRLHAHHRRQVPQEETKALLIELAQELEKGGVPRENVTAELCKVVPFSERYVRQLMPQEYKQAEKVEAGQKGGQESAALAHQTVTTQDIIDIPTDEMIPSALVPLDTAITKLLTSQFQADLIPCAGGPDCALAKMGLSGFPKSRATEINGKQYCPSCAPFAHLKVKAKEAADAPAPTPARVKESWEQRQAQMHPQKSKMELEMLEIFSNDDLLRPVQTDRSFPVVQVTPDFIFPRHNLCIFLDGKEAHAGREDRDETLREVLQGRYGMTVLSIPYNSNSEAEKQRIHKTVKEAV